MSARTILQWSRREKRKAFTDMCQRITCELAMNSARRHLDVYLAHADLLLEAIPSTQDNFVSDGRILLAALRRQVESRGLAANDVRVS